MCVIWLTLCWGDVIRLRVSLLGVAGWVLFLGCFVLGHRGGGGGGGQSGVGQGYWDVI